MVHVFFFLYKYEFHNILIIRAVWELYINSYYKYFIIVVFPTAQLVEIIS